MTTLFSNDDVTIRRASNGALYVNGVLYATARAAADVCRTIAHAVVRASYFEAADFLETIED